MYPLAVNIAIGDSACIDGLPWFTHKYRGAQWMGKHWAPTDLTFTRQLETGSACVAGCGSYGCGPQHSAGHVRLRTREVTWIAAAGGFRNPKMGK
jgi:hypothetical protein